jgi:3-hydroxyacyl-[acyl-carrier-protein] dehydratase
VPGDTLRLEVTMEKLGSRFGKGRGVASVDGEVACEGLLSFIIPPEGTLR